jgi:putative ABC transport system permease protein
MTGVGHDIRFALRGLRARPGSALVTVLILALGIGANTAVFSVVDALVLRPLSFPQPEQLVTLPTGLMYADFAEVRVRSQSFQGLAAHRLERMTLTGHHEPQTVNAVVASADLFDLLGVTPLVGRGFRPGEDQPGQAPVAVLSHGFWRRMFGEDRQVIGKSVVLDGVSVVVIGVMPAAFQFPLDEEPADLWLAFQYGGPIRQSRQWRGYMVFRTIGRLAPAVSLAQARTDLGQVAASLAQSAQGGHPGSGYLTLASYDQTVKRSRPALLVLLGAVALVLVIACFNLANLGLVRASARRREMAIRSALGAGRARLARQLMTESLVLALLGAGLGLVLAVGGVKVLAALLPADLPRPHDFTFDGRVLGYTLAAAVLTALLVGLAPSLQGSRTALGGVLRAGDRGAAAAQGPWRSLLLVAELGLALVLLVGAGLLVRSFARLTAVDPGFDSSGLLLARIKAPYTMPRTVFYQELQRRLASIPGVRAVAIAGQVPFSRWFGSWSFSLDDRPPPPADAPWWAGARNVSPSYFETMGIALRQGRLFDTSDDQPEAAPVAVVNESFARRHWPRGNAIGRSILAYGDRRLIVGVVADTLGSCGRSGCAGSGAGRLERAVEPEILMPMNGRGQTWYLATRARAGIAPAALAGPVRAAVRALDATVALSEVRTMEQAIDESLGQRRFTMLMLVVFALLALLLAALGIYGVVSCSVGQRTREIGVRMALGAQAANVRWMVVAQSLRLSLLGLALGLLGAIVLTRVMASQLYDVSATDPATFVGLSAVLLAVATLAALIPARRASAVDPAIALRAD